MPSGRSCVCTANSSVLTCIGWKKGQGTAELENFYEEGMPLVRITLDPLLTPNQNAQKYFKDTAKRAQQKKN